MYRHGNGIPPQMHISAKFEATALCMVDDAEFAVIEGKTNREVLNDDGGDVAHKQ